MTKRIIVEVNSDLKQGKGDGEKQTLDRWVLYLHSKEPGFISGKLFGCYMEGTVVKEF